MIKGNEDKKILEFEHKFFLMEQELNLFKRQIYGIYFWHLLRADIFYNYKFKVLKFNKNGIKGLSLSERLKKYFTTSSSAMANNYICDYILFDRGKKSEYNGEYVDIFLQDIVGHLKKENKSFLYIDMPYFSDYIEPKGKNIEGLFIFPAANNIYLNDDEKKLIKEIEEGLFKITGDKYNLTNIIEKRLIRFRKEYLYYKKLFLKRRPKKIFTTLSYRRYPIIAAAKDQGIETIDIQYANISRSHPGYSFPYNDKIPYFPDKLIIWGEFWKDITPIPLSQENILISAPSYYNYIRNKYKNNSKKKITFISQPAFSDMIFKKACEVAEKFNEYDVVLRQHPGEVNKIYEDVGFVEKKNNFYFSNYRNEDLHKLLSETIVQIGVSSTALYEGLLHNCKTIILDLPTSYEMNYLLKNNIAIKSDLKNLDKYILQMIDNKVNYEVNYIYNFSNIISKTL